MAQLLRKHNQLVSRPHAQLGREDPATLGLGWHARHQFNYKEDMEEEKQVDEDMSFAMQTVTDEQQEQQEEEAPLTWGLQEEEVGGSCSQVQGSVVGQ